MYSSIYTNCGFCEYLVLAALAELGATHSLKAPAANGGTGHTAAVCA